MCFGVYGVHTRMLQLSDMCTSTKIERLRDKMFRVAQTIVLSSQTEKLGWAAAFSKSLGQKHSPKFFLKIFEHV